jgi:hypothetical protein
MDQGFWISADKGTSWKPLFSTVSSQGPITRTIYSRICSLVENHRSFIRIAEFFGPDRRRHLDDRFSGKNRRQRSN